MGLTDAAIISAETGESQVQIKEFHSSETSTVVLRNAVTLVTQEVVCNSGRLELMEAVTLKTGRLAPRKIDDKNIIISCGVLIAKKGVTIQAGLCSLEGQVHTEKGLVIISSDAQFVGKAKIVGGVNVSAEELTIMQEANVSVEGTFCLNEGILVNKGTLITDNLTILKGRIVNEGKLETRNDLSITLPADTEPSVLVEERVVEEPPRSSWFTYTLLRRLSSQKTAEGTEISVKQVCLPESKVKEYTRQREDEVAAHNRKTYRHIEFKTKYIDKDTDEITERLTESSSPYSIRNGREISSTQFRMPYKEFLAYKRQKNDEIKEYNRTEEARKLRVIQFKATPVAEAYLSGKTKVAGKAFIQVPRIWIDQAQMDRAVLKCKIVELDSNRFNGLTVVATDHIVLLSEAQLKVREASLQSKKIVTGAKSAIQGIGDTAAAESVTFILDPLAERPRTAGLSFSLENAAVITAKSIQLTSPDGSAVHYGTVKNTGTLRTDKLHLHRIALFENTSRSYYPKREEGDIIVRNLVCEHVNRFKNGGKVEIIPEAQALVVRPYGAPYGAPAPTPKTTLTVNDFSSYGVFKVKGTLEISGAKASLARAVVDGALILRSRSTSVSNIKALALTMECSSVLISGDIKTNIVRINATQQVSVHKDAELKYPSEVILSADMVNVHGKIHVEKISATVRHFLIAAGGSVETQALNVTGQGTDPMLDNHGIIVTTMSFTPAKIRIYNRSEGTLRTGHSLSLVSPTEVLCFTNDGLLDVKGLIYFSNIPFSGAKGKIHTTDKVLISLSDRNVCVGGISAPTASITGKTVTLSGTSWQIKELSVWGEGVEVNAGANIHLRTECALCTPQAIISGSLSTPKLVIYPSTHTGKFKVTSTGRVTTQKDIVWINVDEVENDGEIKIIDPISWRGLKRIIQNGLLASQGEVVIVGDATEVLTTIVKPKGIRGTKVTLNCKRVEHLFVHTLGEVIVATTQDMNVALIEAHEITLSSAQKITVYNLIALHKITLLNAKEIVIRQKIKAGGDIALDNKGVLAFETHTGAEISSANGEVGVLRPIKKDRASGVISGKKVIWSLPPTTDPSYFAEFCTYGYDRGYGADELRVKAQTEFVVSVSFPIRLSGLPKFLRDSNLKFETSEFVSTHSMEFPHSLTLSGLTTTRFNDGYPLKVKGVLSVHVSGYHTQQICSDVDTGRGWYFDDRVDVGIGDRLTATEGDSHALALTVQPHGKVMAKDLSVSESIEVTGGRLFVMGDLKADTLINKRSGVAPSVVTVEGSARITSVFRNEWESPSIIWPALDTAKVEVGGDLTVGRAFTNKCGQVYVNGLLIVSGSTFENRCMYVEHRGLQLLLKLKVTDETFKERIDLSSPNLSLYEGPEKVIIAHPLLKRFFIKGASNLSSTNYPAHFACFDGEIKYNPAKVSNDKGDHLGFFSTAAVHFDLGDRARVTERNGSGAGWGFLFWGGWHKTIFRGYEVDYDEPVHAHKTSVVARGGLYVNGSPLSKVKSSEPSSEPYDGIRYLPSAYVVNDGILAASNVEISAPTITSGVSSSRETPLPGSGGVVRFTLESISFVLGGMYSIDPVTGAGIPSFVRGTSTALVIGKFSELSLQPSNRLAIRVGSGSGGSTSYLTSVSHRSKVAFCVKGDIDTLRQGLIRPNHMLENCSLHIAPITQEAVATFTSSVFGIIDDMETPSQVQFAWSPVMEFRLFSNFVTQTPTIIFDNSIFSTREAFLKASQALALYFNQHKDIEALPYDIRKAITLAPSYEMAVEYLEKRIAKKAVADAEEEAFVTAVTDRREDLREDPRKYPLQITADEAREVAETLNSITAVLAPIQLGGERYYQYQYFLPTRTRERLKTSATGIFGETVRINGEQLVSLKNRVYAEKDLHVTARDNTELYGELNATNGVYITTTHGNIEIGPYFSDGSWRPSVIGGKHHTVIIAEEGQVHIYPGTVLLGEKVTVQCALVLYLAPAVSTSWHTKREACGLFGLGTKTTDYQQAHYTDRIIVDNPDAAVTLNSVRDDVDISGAHLTVRSGHAFRGPVVVMAGKDIIADAVKTKLAHRSESSFIVPYHWEDGTAEAVRETRLQTIPNLVTLERALKNREVMEAVLAKLLGVADERHLRLFETHPDILALRESTLTLSAQGDIRGRGAKLAAAFVNIIAGGSVDLTAAESESETHSCGWSLDFGVLGEALVALFDTRSQAAAMKMAGAAEADHERIMAAHMGPLFTIMVDVLLGGLHDQFKEALLRAGPVSLTAGGAAQTAEKDRVTTALMAVARPFAAVLSLNVTELGMALSQLFEMEASDHDWKGAGMAVAWVNAAFQFFKMADMINAVIEHGFEKVWKEGLLDAAKGMVRVGVSFYNQYVQKKTPVKGEIQALLGLNLRADVLQLTGTDTESVVTDIQARKVHYGAVCETVSSQRVNAGASINLALTASIHGEWATDQYQRWVPTHMVSQFVRFGSMEHPVDEFIMHGGTFHARLGTGRIRKLVMVHEADTHEQGGMSAGAGFSFASGAPALSSVSMGGRGGKEAKIAGGKCVFSAPGVVIDTTEEITPEEYNRRVGVKMMRRLDLCNM
ncbi:MAG: hypothetical protein H6492_01585 [Candidatus Paracaedibacteraceae bacterium]|nr:hypothetical protein [Candidatus Paracaedibacteraceae bacterium]